MHADGTFEVLSSAPVALPDGLVAAGLATGLMVLDKTYTGGITGRSSTIFTSAYDPTAGVGTYVALETFDGCVNGRNGRSRSVTPPRRQAPIAPTSTSPSSRPAAPTSSPGSSAAAGWPSIPTARTGSGWTMRSVESVPDPRAEDVPGLPLPAVSGTAIRVAGVRARESSRPDALFHDPYAGLFAERLAPLRDDSLDQEPPDEDAARRARGRAFHVIIRTCYYDDFLQAAAGAGIRQAVLIGAGLDARAFRLGWPPGMTIFEVDLPGVLAAKEQVLQSASAVPRADRRTVAADLTAPLTPPLAAAGFDPGAPAAWLAEGVLIYLAAADVRRLLGEITSLSVPRSRFAAESGTRAQTPAVPYGVEALWQSGGADGPDAVLPQLGWSVEVKFLGDVAAGYGRPIGRPTASSFVTAVRD